MFAIILLLNKLDFSLNSGVLHVVPFLNNWTFAWEDEYAMEKFYLVIFKYYNILEKECWLLKMLDNKYD